MVGIDKIVAEMGHGRFIVWQGGPCRRSDSCCEDCSSCQYEDDRDVVEIVRAQRVLTLMDESDVAYALDRMSV
ncbi:MAG: hypothetical protein AAB560_00340 [Patescibacteria group bacterium]